MPTKIEWCDETFNPVTGCTPISIGCANCYASRMSKRLAGRAGYDKDEPFKITLHADKLSQPGRWKKPRRIFVCSMGDLFHEDVPNEWIDEVFAMMILNQRHVFQVLTKRPERALKYFINHATRSKWGRKAFKYTKKQTRYNQSVIYNVDPDVSNCEYPPPNIWFGVTAENQEMADKRIPILLDIPAAVRFVSVEPMLGPVDLSKDIGGTLWIGGQRGCNGRHRHNGSEAHHHHDNRCKKGLDWIICGGETGSGARTMPPEGPRGLRDQCAEAGVPFFFKSWGKWSYYEGPLIRCIYNHGTGHYNTGEKDHLLDGKEYHQFPEIKNAK